MTAARRWLRFNLIGVGGFVVQLATLATLTRLTHVPVSIAVTIAVLVTVSHNFFWHERVTWPNQSPEGRWRRWLAFHASNGLISIATNVAMTGPIVRMTGLSVVGANIVAVAAAALVNFAASDRLVFRR
jgi:putative flippase GtrA